MLEAAIYPFLFLSLFFEVFLILTYFENESIRRRNTTPTTAYPTVYIIVPCYNEAETAAATVDSLLNLDYPKNRFELLLINDGSTDTTATIIESYASTPNVRIISKSNGGKHTALNAGISLSQSEFIACIDADSFVSPGALRESIAHFDNANIGAVTASMSIHKPRTGLERMQQAEYLLGILLRHILSTFNGLYVTPGPFTVYRRKIFSELGSFKSAHNTEDMEIALRMQKAGWQIQNAPRARVYTKAPSTVRSLLKQRVRWTTGFIRNSFDYRELFGNPAYGALGMIVLPLGAISILSTIGLFLLAIVRLGMSAWDFGIEVASVPLSFAFRIPIFDWFFVPVDALTVLSIIALAITIAFIIEGARMSKTRAAIGSSLLWYIPLYGILAPVWLMRAVIDVAFGIRRSWR